MANRSGDFFFELTGFPGIPPQFDILVSFMMFILYMATLFSNGSVMVLITMKEKLHEPLYIMIANLAFSNLFYDTVTLPKFIAKYWIDGGRISLLACIIQVYFVHMLPGIDAFILMLMAFDRYVAICKPLRYSSIVTHRVSLAACGMMWLIIALCALMNLLILKHSFCGPNKIVSFFCNSSTLILLACDENNSTRATLLTTGLVLLFLPLTFIILSYAIILSIITLNHSKGWRKALSTCTTHWIVMALFYVPRVFVYIANYARLILSPDLSVFLIFLYSYLPHLANPLIYCLRTEEIKRTINNIFKSKLGT
ncbi:olfactory receptor 6P1-like [Hyla sarda]|uniref:olfactory receptor 6P1-like n=1 Tax=Hyla sarda TaxID=327740 RepID=UPI0024C27E67|nr:olfactory receptor 6P1-like [Hyla sarda]